MNKASRLALIVMTCGGLLLPAGCTRTSDGSVVLARPSRLTSFARPQPAPVYSPAPAVALAAPPAAPEPERRIARPVRWAGAAGAIPTWKVQVVKPPFEQTAPDDPLSCRNETSPVGRVRVVCD
jgi:hypothetical protein